MHLDLLDGFLLVTVLSTGFCSCVVTPVYAVPFCCVSLKGVQWTLNRSCSKQSLAARTFIKIRKLFCFLYWIVLQKECFRVSTCQISLWGIWAAFYFPLTCCYFLNLLCPLVACRKWQWCEAGLFSWGVRAHLVFAADSGHTAPSPSLPAPGPHHHVLLKLHFPLCGRHQVLFYDGGLLTDMSQESFASLNFGGTWKYRGNRLVPSTREMWRNMPLTPKGLRVLWPFFPFIDERSFWKTVKIP